MTVVEHLKINQISASNNSEGVDIPLIKPNLLLNQQLKTSVYIYNKCMQKFPEKNQISTMHLDFKESWELLHTNYYIYIYMFTNPSARARCDASRF